MSAICNEARASARTGGRLGLGILQTLNIFSFVSLSLKNSFFSFSSSFLSFVSNQSCVLELCRINVSTFFFTFFYISLVFCFLSTLFVLTKFVFSLLLCLFFFAFVLSAGF